MCIRDRVVDIYSLRLKIGVDTTIGSNHSSYCFEHYSQHSSHLLSPRFSGSWGHSLCWWRSSWGGFPAPLLLGAFCWVLIIMRCKGKKCRKAPQSGYEGYCKSCFRLKFPSRHASKQERRRKECPCCGETKELHSSGVCRPCMRARSCESCSKVNVAVEASFCPTCELQREKLGATRQRLAMWCTDCFSTQQLASGKCRACFSHIVKCHHCNKQDVDLSKPFSCSESDCASVFYMCATCLPYFQGREKVQCKSCWHASGDLLSLIHI